MGIGGVGRGVRSIIILYLRDLNVNLVVVGWALGAAVVVMANYLSPYGNSWPVGARGLALACL